MASVITKQDKDTGYTEYICETLSDLNAIPFKEQLFGCMAYVISVDTVYIMNANSQWEAT